MYGFGITGGHWGGAVSEQLLVPFADAMLVPLPEGIDPVAAASVADNVSDGYRHIGPHLPGLLARDPASRVLILAASKPDSPFSASVPLYAGLVARALGASHVHFVDSRAKVRAQAASLGLISLPYSALDELPPAELVLSAVDTPKGLARALAHTARDGVCSSAGGLHSHARIPIGLLYGRNVSFHLGRTHARAVIPQVLDLMVSGRLAPERVTTYVAPMDEAPRAMREHTLGDSTKTILSEA
jgi:alcohol dehydrogenase